MARVERALISVSDKQGIEAFAKALTELGIDILSTGGTAKLLQSAGIVVTEVSEHTGFPEIMDGRVKTLHPRIHGGLLGRRDVDAAVMAKHDIAPIDLLVVNLYPFEQTVANRDCSLPVAIENIDIGGPAMLRAAAKNHAVVTVVVDAADYDRVLEELRAGDGEVSADTRFELARKTYAHTAHYDGAIANYLGSVKAESETPFPPTLSLQFEKLQDMRYGENPHQGAAFYRNTAGAPPASLASAELIQGKPLSFNNVADADAALECVKEFGAEPACVIVKHANPCGVAVAANLGQAYDLAFGTDPTSAFGGIIALNQPLDEALAQAIIDRQFVEVILAPDVSAEARKVLAAKPGVRVLSTGSWQGQAASEWNMKRVGGGLLVQQGDSGRIGTDDLKVVSRRAPSVQEQADLLFAWKVAKFVKSNAIVYCRDQRTIGVGAGQMSRIYSARIAAIKAADEDLEVRGSVMASDAFFPFRDGIDAAAEVGITAVIQPGGSIRDEEVIAAADEYDIAMVFTGMRHFRH